MSFRYLSPIFELGHNDPKLVERRAGDPIRPYSIVVSAEGAMPPNAYFIPREEFFQYTLESERYQPLVLFVLPGCPWLAVDAALRGVADDRFYVSVLPELFSAWSEWEAARG